MWGKKNGAGMVTRNLPGMENVQALMKESEAVLRATANQGNEVLQDARTRLEKSLRDVRASLGEFDSQVLAKRTLRAARATDEYAHGHPWPVVLAGLGLGLLIGIALTRGRY